MLPGNNSQSLWQITLLFLNIITSMKGTCSFIFVTKNNETLPFPTKATSTDCYHRVLIDKEDLKLYPFSE